MSTPTMCAHSSTNSTRRPGLRPSTTSAVVGKLRFRCLRRIAKFESLMGKTLDYTLVDNNRVGDHICYISHLGRIQADHPGWRLKYDLDRICHEIAGVS